MMMPTTATEPAEASTALPVDDLARAVLRALEVGNRPGQLGCEIKVELPDRLHRDGVEYRPEDLPLALIKLEDSGCITRAQKQLQPQRVVSLGLRYFDDVDQLAADIAGLIKEHGEEFESEDQVRTWLDEAGVEYDDRSFIFALHQLEELGRVKRPRQDHWNENAPLPGVYVPPRVHPLSG